MTVKRKYQVFAVAILILLSCCGFLAFSVISFPPTETIARRYLTAVLNEDLEVAIQIANGNCPEQIRENALKDIEQFGNVEIQDLVIERHYNYGGSDEKLQFAIITFDYRVSSQTEWQDGEMWLPTYHERPGIRYSCGNYRRE